MNDGNTSGGPGGETAEGRKLLERERGVAEDRLVVLYNDRDQPIYLPPPKLDPEFSASQFVAIAFRGIMPNYCRELVLRSPPEDFWARWKGHKKVLRVEPLDGKVGGGFLTARTIGGVLVNDGDVQEEIFDALALALSVCILRNKILQFPDFDDLYEHAVQAGRRALLHREDYLADQIFEWLDSPAAADAAFRMEVACRVLEQMEARGFAWDSESRAWMFLGGD